MAYVAHPLGSPLAATFGERGEREEISLGAARFWEEG